MDRLRREEIRKTAYAVGFPRNMIDELIADLEAIEEKLQNREQDDEMLKVTLLSVKDQWDYASGSPASIAKLVIHELLKDREAVEQKLRIAREALTRIEKWFGEFPETGRFWDEEEKEPMSYAAAYGSNGERDFMRKLARKALREIGE